MSERQFEVTEDLYASNKIRLANYLIDYVVQFLLGGLIGVVIGLICLFTSNNDLLYKIENMNRIEEYALGIVILLIYYNITEILLGRSISKFITKTIVVMEDGSKPNAQAILVRTLSRIIPFNHLSFLGTPCRGWHDSISKTYVVQKKLLEEKRNLFYSFEEIGKTEEI